MILPFSVEGKAASSKLSYDIRGAIMCGYTGRDQSAVQRHIEELEKEGVEPPPSVPAFYPKPPQGVALEEVIEVQGRETSGEVEFVLLLDGERTYVGVASDHTDRELERMDILKSKQISPAIVSGTLWDYEEIKEHWDRIEIRSWVMIEGERTLYQESTLATILPPEELVRLVRQRVTGSLDGIAIFSGTPPMLTEGMVFSGRFEGELSDPVTGRKLTIDYTTQPLEWFNE
jgi:hypothetical protein